MKSQEYMNTWGKDNPKSVCACGHTGDGGNSQHADRFQLGHGVCLVRDCNCQQFTWVEWTDEAKTALELR